MKTKLTLAALLAFAAIAQATPGQSTPPTVTKTKHAVRTGHLSDVHMPSLHQIASATPAKAQVRANLTHPATAPGPK